MRNPSRLNNFYDTMKLLHQTCFPDWRWGQLIYNFTTWLQNEKHLDCFFPEETQMMEYFKEFCKTNNSKAYEQFEGVTNNEDICNN